MVPKSREKESEEIDKEEEKVENINKEVKGDDKEKPPQKKSMKSFGFIKKKTYDFSQLQRPTNYVDIERLWNYEKNILDYRILELTSKSNKKN
jgi:hypothetical protein